MIRHKREIDGLRAVAVIPVILFHAGFQGFKGGFVGVDIFFVISGYLITRIILQDLEEGRFSLLGFYEGRIRRIVPALFLVMVIVIPFAYAWMMPDEFKNFGQSLFATSIFSNNILLSMTEDYWNLNNEFKPLLHSWSLGVEGQYYVLFPLLLMAGWAFFRRHIFLVIVILFCASFAMAIWGVAHRPHWAFYLLPTRAWEILLGALAAFRVAAGEIRPRAGMAGQFLALAGVALILVAVLTFDADDRPPGLTSLVPTLGTALIILFASEGTVAYRFLSSRLLVGLGLISYSLYLWHQPLFALARVYSVGPPGPGIYLMLAALSVPLAYLTWRFVETPFRLGTRVSRGVLAGFAVPMTVGAVIFGYYLDSTYGMAGRIYGSDIRIADMDKRAYNEQVFHLKKEIFTSRGKLKLLVIGNSFGRDFVNMVTEVFDLSDIEIIYRDDLAGCLLPYRNEISGVLLKGADIIAFAGTHIEINCVNSNIQFAKDQGKEIFYVGSKNFGYNINWIARIQPDQRRNLYNKVPDSMLNLEKRLVSNIPAENFISLLGPVVKDGAIPVTDDQGRVLSTDRRHVTKFGATFLGQRALVDSRFGTILRAGPRN